MDSVNTSSSALGDRCFRLLCSMQTAKSICWVANDEEDLGLNVSIRNAIKRQLVKLRVWWDVVYFRYTKKFKDIYNLLHI